MAEVTISQAPSFPMARACPMHPPAEYASLRSRCPVSRITMPDGQQAWLITKYQHARALLVDRRVSSDRTHPAYPLVTNADRKLLQNQIYLSRLSLIGMDPPTHTAQRQMVITDFSVRSVQAMRPQIKQIVDECVDDMLACGGPVDLVQKLSLAVASQVICELLGVPYADRAIFQERTTVLNRRTSTLQQSMAAANELYAYLDHLVTAKEAAPGDDLLGRLIVKNRKTGTLDHGAVVGMATLLLQAGHETTANMISLGTVALLEYPTQLAELQANPKLIPQAVEELLRYLSVSDVGTSRVATEDIEINGETIRAGEGIVVAGMAANWDDEVFAEPERLDIHRSARHHLAFGFGVHQCLGQNLARLELEIVFETLFRRIPDLRLAVPAAELPYKDDAFIYGLYEVPVTWSDRKTS